mgnify:CR=1 FL=1
MVQQQAALLKPESLVAEFKKNGVTHIVTIPDSETNYLYELMLEQDWLDVVPSSREGETFAIALGLIVGGKVPVCVIQNTGMMESGDSIRGMAIDSGFPLVMLIGYRGWTRHGVITEDDVRASLRRRATSEGGVQRWRWRRGCVPASLRVAVG